MRDWSYGAKYLSGAYHLCPSWTHSVVTIRAMSMCMCSLRQDIFTALLLLQMLFAVLNIFSRVFERTQTPINMVILLSFAPEYTS